MLGNGDKKFVQMLVGAFNEAMEEEHGPKKDSENTNPLIDYGAALLDCEDKPTVKMMWYGFYMGFSKGAEFMAAANEDPEGARKALGVEA